MKHILIRVLCFAVTLLLLIPTASFAAYDSPGKVTIALAVKAQMAARKLLKLNLTDKVDLDYFAKNDIKFDFDAVMVPEDELDKAHIGKTINHHYIMRGKILGPKYVGKHEYNENYYNTLTDKDKIDTVNSVHFSTVNFNKNDLENRYFELENEIPKLEKEVESYINEAKNLDDSDPDYQGKLEDIIDAINHVNDRMVNLYLTKYWGALYGNKDFCLIKFRAPSNGGKYTDKNGNEHSYKADATPEQLAKMKASGWGDDVVGWKGDTFNIDIFHKVPFGLHDDTSKSIYDTQYKPQKLSKITDFDVINTYGLHYDPQSSFALKGIDRFPLTKLTYKNDSIVEIEKPLFRLSDIEEFSKNIGGGLKFNTNDIAATFYKPVNTSDIQQVPVLRYYLVEKPNEKLNKKYDIDYSKDCKILDVTHNSIMIFNNADEADEFYKNVELQGLVKVFPDITVSRFTNSIKNNPQNTPKITPTPNITPTPDVPKTGDNRNITMYIICALIAVAGALLLINQKRKQN